MSQVALFECTVSTPKGTYAFAAEIHESHNQDSRLLPLSFYEMGEPPNIPEGTHHEMLLTESPVYGRAIPDVPIHVYKHPETDKHFVCWTMPVPTLVQAREVFDWWCLGTVYSLEHERDFALLLVDYADDMPEYLEQEYGIRLT